MVTLSKVKGLLAPLLLAGLLGAATGCGASATPEPAVLPHEAPQTRAPRRHERPLPRLIAPPPAYGNRVVMARGASTSSQN